MFLLKFFTDKLRLKLISPKFSNQNKKSSISSTISLVFIEFCTVFFGILLVLYIDRWNSSQNIEKQFESTLKIIQKNLESDIYNSDDVFISSFGNYEFYKKEKLRIGSVGPETIWQKQ